MKIKRFDVSMDFFKEILGPGIKHFEAIKNALPADAELVRIFIDPNKSSLDIISLFFISESYPILPEGTLLEPETIEFVKHYYQSQKGETNK